METKKIVQFSLIILVSILAITLLGAAGLILKSRQLQQRACTQEAKLCPDGSAVGRTGPNCEFAACPATASSKIDTATWKTYRNEKYGFEVKYPPQYEIRDLTKENRRFDAPLVLLIGICDVTFDVGCDGPSIHIYKGKFREPSIAQDTYVKELKRNELTFWLGGNENIISTFKFTK